jgi:periplasmic divalent cation tolerance protein
MQPEREQPPGSKATAMPMLTEIRTTFPTREAAEACAAALVADRVAACVQIDGPVQSTYRWQGAVEQAAEFRCICKTAPERANDCVESIVRMHGYETPEILVSAVAASPAYEAWVRSSVGLDSGAAR